MSMFEDNRYRWRETYFVLFPTENRPTLTDVAKTLTSLNKRFHLTNLNDEDGLVDSLTLISPDDFAALDICYTEGDEVLEQTAPLIDDLKKGVCEDAPFVDWAAIKQYEGRFDVLHFEQVAEEEEEDDMLDPSALLVVLEALAKLTSGVAIDPQAGTILSDGNSNLDE